MLRIRMSFGQGVSFVDMPSGRYTYYETVSSEVR